MFAMKNNMRTICEGPDIANPGYLFVQTGLYCSQLHHNFQTVKFIVCEVEWYLLK